MEACASVTEPPFEMVNWPVPELPTTMEPVLVQRELAPVTVAVPSEPAALPIVPKVSLAVPPLRIVSVPVPALPTVTLALLVQVEPEPSTVTAPVDPA